MKKNIGNKLALYPTPAVVVGAEVDGKPTWTLVAHIGIVAHDRLLVSLHSAHYINKGIKEAGRLSVNIVTEDILPEADYCGVTSGAKTDKSRVFEHTTPEGGAPMIDRSPLTMDCRVEDIYESGGFENFVCSVAATYADDTILTAEGKIDYESLHPVLFEMSTYQYLRTGGVIAPCMKLGREYKKEHE